MSVISYNDFFKKKKKKEDEDDIAPTKKSGSVISLEDFAKENNMKISLDKSGVGGKGSLGSGGGMGSRGDSYASLSDEELTKKEKELTDQILAYERKEKRKWWDKEDNVFENVGNVLYKTFLEKQEDKYVKDDVYDSLVAQDLAILEEIENRYVENKEYKDGAMGYAEKAADTWGGNMLTGIKGIETTAKKILGQTPDERLTTPSFQEKLVQKAREETTGAAGVGLDVIGSIGRMTPQLMIGNPLGATAVGFANYGGGAYNQARQDGYTDEQATAYGIAIGSMEMIMTKALGSFGNVYGKSAVGKASQSVIDKTIPKIISNKQVREVIAQFGSEATEEFLQEYIDGIAKDTLLDGEGLLKSTWKNITDEDKLSDALYSAFVGGITGSTMATSGAIDSYRYEKATGRNYETGLTQNEQTVVDKVTEQRTSEKQKQAAINKEVEKTIKAQEKTFGTLSDAEKKGIKQRIQEKVESGEIDIANTKLSKKEIEKIQREVREDLEKGYIDIDTIDSTFSGEKTAQIKQLQEELSNTKDATKKAEIQAKINELTSARASELQGKFNNDIYLQRSYIENAKKGEEFTYEAKETDSDYRKTLTEEFKEKANNTNKTHETYEMLVKLSEEKGTQYHITNTEELKNMGYDVEGSDINGLVRVDKDGTQRILINIDSNKAINRIVGHETTHLLEGTKEYKTFQEYIKNYAEAQGEYDTRYKQISNLYTGIDADIDAEVTADLVGDYLFTDTDFINNLSVEQPTIFQKIYNEIKHLYNLATAGSKEARDLERVKRAFDKAYKQNASNMSETDAKYSISEKVPLENRVSGDDLLDAQDLIDELKSVGANVDENGYVTVYHQTPNENAQKIKETGKMISKELDIFFSTSKNAQQSEGKGQTKLEFKIPAEKLVLDDIFTDNADVKIPLNGAKSIDVSDYLVTKTDTKFSLSDIEAKTKENMNKRADSDKIEYIKTDMLKDIDTIGRGNRPAITEQVKENGITEPLIITINDYGEPILEDGNHRLEAAIELGLEKVPVKIREANDEQTDMPFKNLSELNTDAFKKTNVKYSLSDNKGRILTKEQQDFFKDSKVRDEEGRLIKVYHGTLDEDFTVFEGDYFYFTEDYETADVYGGGSVREVYLNIKNPYVVDAKNSSWNNIDGKTTDEIVKEVLEMNKNGANYDGVMFKNIIDTASTVEYLENPSDWITNEYVAFKSNQVKNADNTNPTENPDIRYSLSYKSVDEQLYDKYSEKVDNGYNVVNEYKQKYNEVTNTEEFKNLISRMVKEHITPESDVYKNEIANNPIWQKADKIKEALDYWQKQLDLDKQKLNEVAERLDAQEEANKPKLTPEEIVKKAEKHFGITNNFKETAYIDINGNQIDFSGKHEGGPSGVRTLDHRQINEIDTDMDSFINMGNIRILPEGGGINLAIEPNAKQYSKLRDYIDSVNDEIYIDIDKPDGTYDSANYKAGTSSSKIINDIRVYFETGSFPKQSEFAQFRYSLSRESEQIAPSRNDVFGSDIKLQVEEAIAPIQEEIAELKEQLNLTSESIQPNERVDEYAPMTEEEFSMYEEQDRESFRNIDESSMPTEIEEDIPYQVQDTTSIDDKSLKMLSKNIKSELGLDKYQTSKLEGIIQDFSTGKIETKEELYNEIKRNFSEYTEQVRVQEIKNVQNDLRNTRINVSKNAQNGIKDYFRIKQKNFGKIRFSKEGLGVDSVYQELSSKYPDYFPADIDTQSDQFLRMVEVANMQNTFNEKYILPNEVIQDATDFIAESVDDYKYNEWMKAIDEQNRQPIDESMMPIEEIVEDASNTEVKEDIAPVRSKVDWDSIEAIDPNTAKQLTLDGTEEDLVKKTKKELRKALLGTEAQKEFITNVLDNAKNRSMALMNNTDTIRNTELVFGRDAGKIINDVIFQKEIDNEADSIAWQNQERDDIKALGIKARSKESAAVQKYGEKQYVNDAGEVIAYGDNELASEFKDAATQEKIKRAAQLIRNKYDNYIDLANGVLTKLGFEPIKKRNDYMRHFQELNDVFSRYGIPFNAQNMDEHTLPTDINGLTEFWSPQKNYFANMQQRKGLKTTYDAITGIDGYIGGIANLIYHTEDIQRGRAFEELIRETYGEDKGFDNLENLPDELKQARMEKIQDNHLSNYAAWVHEWTNNVAGKKSKIDRSVEAMFGRKAFALLDEARKQVGSNMIGFNLSSSLTNLIAPVQAMAKTNKLAVVKGTADTIKNIFVKDNFMDNNKFLVSRMGSDMISKNAWQKIQDAGFIFMKGMDWFSSNQIVRSKYYELRSKGMSEAEAHAEAGKFAARILGDRTKGANAQLYNSKLIGLVTQFQLEVNNQLYSTFYDTYHESKENAQNNALKTAAGMTFTLGQLFAFTHLFGKTFEAIAGYNPTLDVIGILKTAFGWGEDDEDEEKTTSERLKAAADQLVDSLPYVNILTGGGRIPVASGIPNLVGVATGGKDEYGNELTLEGEMKKLLYLVPPTGGNQVKKTTQGLGMFDDDLPVSGSYTDSGNLRFPVEDTVMNRIQAGIFGQYANENAGNYFDNKRQPLKEKQIQEYADLDMPIADYWEYREGLKEQSTTQEKFDYINSLDVSDKQKNIMINNALDRKEAIDMSNYGDFGGYDEFDYATKNPDKYKVIEQIDTFDNYIAYKEDIASIKEQFSSDNGYTTEQRKAAVQQYIQSLNLDVPQKIMLEKMAGGYSIKSYKNYIQSYIQSLPLTAQEKQAIDNQLFN